MPVGGKLVLKGGAVLAGVQKKAKKKKGATEKAFENSLSEDVSQTLVDSKTGKKMDTSAINVMSGKTYEQEFDLETARVKEGKTRNTPWGSTYRAPPEILHGYNEKVLGKTASERLDLRAASKCDKFCK